MNEASINLNDYLSEDEMKEIAVSEFRARIQKSMDKEADLKRLLSNVSYDVVEEIIEQEAGVILRETIPFQVEQIIKEMTAFNVFSKPDAWDRTERSGYKYLTDALESNKQAISERVCEVVEALDVDYLRDEISKAIAERVCGEQS